jgi:ssDNA-binding replication factor A large subunit
LEFVNSFVDLCCTVKDQEEASNFTSNAGNELTKKTVTVFDSSFATIEMTLWNEMAVRDYPPGTIMILKRMKITEFNGAMRLGFNRFSSEIMTGNTIMHNPEV